MIHLQECGLRADELVADGHGARGGRQGAGRGGRSRGGRGGARREQAVQLIQLVHYYLVRLALFVLS